jgi:hypothetical protein
MQIHLPIMYAQQQRYGVGVSKRGPVCVLPAGIAADNVSAGTISKAAARRVLSLAIRDSSVVHGEQPAAADSHNQNRKNLSG